MYLGLGQLSVFCMEGGGVEMEIKVHQEVRCFCVCVQEQCWLAVSLADLH